LVVPRSLLGGEPHLPVFNINHGKNTLI